MSYAYTVVDGVVDSRHEVHGQMFDYEAFNARQNMLLEEEEHRAELRKAKATAEHAKRQRRIKKLTKELNRLNDLWYAGQKTLELFCQMDTIEEELLKLV